MRRRACRVRGVADAPANLGRLCAKGALLGETIATPDRLTHADGARLAPRAVPARRPGTPPSATSPRRSATSSTGTAPTRSPSTAAASSTPRRSTSACKLFKGHLGTNNTDSNSRLCMAAAVAGYRTSLGSDGPPLLLRRHRPGRRDLHHRQQHGRGAPGHLRPRQGGRKAASPTVELIVVDPRRTATAEARRPAPPGRARRRHRPAQRPRPAAARRRRGRRAASSPTTPSGFDEYPRLPAGAGRWTSCAAAAGVDR